MQDSDETKSATTGTGTVAPAARAPRKRSPRKPPAAKSASTPAADDAPKAPARSRRRPTPAVPAAAASTDAPPAKKVRPPRKRTPKPDVAPVELESSVEDLSSRRKAKVGVEGELTRAQAADALRALADGLQSGNIATKGDESKLSLGVPDALTFELKLVKRGRRARLSFELKWRNAKEEAPATESKDDDEKSAKAEKKARKAARQAEKAAAKDEVSLDED